MEKNNKVTKYTDLLQDVLSYSRQEAERLGNNYVGPEHFLLGILRGGQGKAIEVLNQAKINLPKVKSDIESQIRTDMELPGMEIPLLKSSDRIMMVMELERRSLSAESIDTEHLLLAILRENKNLAADTLRKENLTYKTAKAFFEEPKQNAVQMSAAGFQDDDEEEEENEKDKEKSDKKSDKASTEEGKKSDTPALDSFGKDITRDAANNKLDPVVGREKEIERLAQVLSRRKKNNPVLIGDPGVGKSAIVEGLALRIVQRRVSRVLFGKRVFSLDMAALVAGTKYRGQFEERIKSVVNEISKRSDIILFIDEIHTLVGAGSASGSLDAANILKPALSRGEIQCIGATTLDEYRQSIEKDGALERRFQKIIVEPTTPEETLTILQNIQEKYEQHHNVRYTEEAIKACVRLTDRYITNRAFPDKAIDALDEAGSRVHLSDNFVPVEIEDLEAQIEELRQEKKQVLADQKYELAGPIRDKEKLLQYELEDAVKQWEKESLKKPECVDEEQVAEVVAMMSGVPVQRIAQAEGIKLRKMKDVLKSKVIGQNEAVEKIVKAIQRNRIGLKDPAKPIGTFMFLGSTGVGKTHLAKALAEFMFDSSDSLIRVDMGEFQEKFSVSRLIGAPPGYVGYEEGGQLTEKVRRKPYSIVLLDEIEKAHSDVFNLLLQVMDEGHLTDSLGRKIDFKNTIIIMTSNIGTRQLKDFGRGIGFNLPDDNNFNSEHARGVIKKALDKQFSPEFLNRIDEIIVFDQLGKDAIFNIIDLELKGLFKRVTEMGYYLKLSNEAKEFIAKEGCDIQYGARPLKRAIQRYLEDELAEIVLSGELLENDTIIMELDSENKKIVAKIDLKSRKEEYAEKMALVEC